MLIFKIVHFVIDANIVFFFFTFYTSFPTQYSSTFLLFILSLDMSSDGS